jgi:hypothetical protein
MTKQLYVLFLIDTLIAFGLVYLIQIPFRKIKNRIVLGLLFLVKTALTLYLAVQIIAFDSTLIWNNEYIFGALYLAMISDVLKDIVCFIIGLFRKEKISEKLRLIVATVITVLFTAYNIINMATITPAYHEIRSSKLDNEYTLIFFSDLHYGSSQSEETFLKALEQMKNTDADCLLLGGDITDENTTKEEMEFIYEQIGSFDIPVYFIYGNHDRQERGYKVGGQKFTEKELEETILKNGITILCEDYVRFADDLVILGREDPSHAENRKAVKDLPKLPSDCYVVSVYHNPNQNDEIKELKADLMLSGHTHAGQFFPVQTIYNLIGMNTCGDYYIGDTHLYVSPGIAGWYLPLRSESHCYYEVFTLTPE